MSLSASAVSQSFFNSAVSVMSSSCLAASSASSVFVWSSSTLAALHSFSSFCWVSSSPSACVAAVLGDKAGGEGGGGGRGGADSPLPAREGGGGGSGGGDAGRATFNAVCFTDTSSAFACWRASDLAAPDANSSAVAASSSAYLAVISASSFSF